MSSVRGLNASPQTPIVFPFSVPKCARIFATSRVFCALLTVFDGLENLEVVFLLGREMDHRLHVLRKAAAAVADPGKQERLTDALVRADRAANFVDVRADRLAHVGDLVHERDARGQHRVRAHTSASSALAQSIIMIGAPVRVNGA